MSIGLEHEGEEGTKDDTCFCLEQMGDVYAIYQQGTLKKRTRFSEVMTCISFLLLL